MWQPVFMISGYILGILGLIMLIPAGLDFGEYEKIWSPFVPSAMVTIFFGFSLFLSNYTKVEKISLKQAYLVTVVSWCAVGVFATLPFLFSNSHYEFADVFFETISGITGTGSTIFADVESLPHSMAVDFEFSRWFGNCYFCRSSVAVFGNWRHADFPTRKFRFQR